MFVIYRWWWWWWWWWVQRQSSHMPHLMPWSHMTCHNLSYAIVSHEIIVSRDVIVSRNVVVSRDAVVVQGNLYQIMFFPGSKTLYFQPLNLLWGASSTLCGLPPYTSQGRTATSEQHKYNMYSYFLLDSFDIVCRFGWPLRYVSQSVYLSPPTPVCHWLSPHATLITPACENIRDAC